MRSMHWNCVISLQTGFPISMAVCTMNKKKKKIMDNSLVTVFCLYYTIFCISILLLEDDLTLSLTYVPNLISYSWQF